MFSAVFNPHINNNWYNDYNSSLEVRKSIVQDLEKDPSGKALNEPGAKADLGKNRVWLFFSGFANALEEVAKVTTLGAQKYTPNGWVNVENGIERYMDAYARHAIALGKGEKIDNGPSGIGTYHKAQMIWNLLASFELELREEDIPVGLDK